MYKKQFRAGAVLFLALSGAPLDILANNGNVSADFRLRYESVDQDNPLKNADALTLRTNLGLTYALSDQLIFKFNAENSQDVLGFTDYSVPPSGVRPGQFSVIADPNHTEIDELSLTWKPNKNLKLAFGRLVLVEDNHRFVGHVGWRQDKQTFDAAGVEYSADNKFKIRYHFIDKRNRIFANDADIDSKDHIVNVSVPTSFGKVTGYAYLLETDTNNPEENHSYGIRLTGSQRHQNVKLSYELEYATQERTLGGIKNDAEYHKVGLTFGMPTFAVEVGQERLGSDNSAYAFQTPLATLHKFNGWADVFLVTPASGLRDNFLKFKTKVWGSNVLLAYHQFEADDTANLLDKDYGEEFNFQMTRKIFDDIAVGIKWAAYDADSFRVDTDKLWIWMAYKYQTPL